MTTALDPVASPSPSVRPVRAVVDLVVPTYNEAATLERSVRRLRAYLDANFPLPVLVTIADNGSIDGTTVIARRLAGELDGVTVLELDQKGRGRALRAAWLASQADVVAYTDVDLSTDLDALLPLVAPLLSGHSDVAIGSRLAPAANVARGAKREIISRTYNLILRWIAGARFSDAQCGFKAVRADVARQVLPLVEDEGWFFDTELLLLAQHNGLRIHEVPVDWTDDPDSRVHVGSTALADLRGVARMLVRFVTGDADLPAAATSMRAAQDRGMARFAQVGAATSVLYLVLFLLLHTFGPLVANAVALTAAAVLNAAAHRLLSSTRPPAAVMTRATLALLGLGLAVSSGALLAVSAAGGGLLVQVVALVAANSVTSAARFITFRSIGLRHVLAKESR